MKVRRELTAGAAAPSAPVRFRPPFDGFASSVNGPVMYLLNVKGVISLEEVSSFAGPECQRGRPHAHLRQRAALPEHTVHRRVPAAALAAAAHGWQRVLHGRGGLQRTLHIPGGTQGESIPIFPPLLEPCSAPIAAYFQRMDTAVRLLQMY